MLWQNWECNPWGYVMQRPDGSRYFSYSQVDQKEVSETTIRSLMKDYRKAMAETQHALNLLLGPKAEEGEKN